MQIRSITDLYNIIQKIGFVPLFSNAVPGFSVEEHTLSSAWWTGDPETDPWVWRQILARDENIAYGKFFDKKAGFISRKWMPVFANYRRNGYDYDALYDDELASYKSKQIMDAFELDEQGCGRKLMTPELKDATGFHRKNEIPAFNSEITELQMQTYLISGDFLQKKNRKGQPYGWHVSVLETPETKWGYSYVTGEYKNEPASSWEEILNQMRIHFPDADEKQIKKVLGIRYPGTMEIKEPKKEKKKRERKYIRPQELPWPENLITEIGLEMVFGENKYSPLSDDQMMGLRAAMDTLREKEREMVCFRYEDHMVLQKIGEKYGVKGQRVRQILAKSIRKLRHPSRLRYYQTGYRQTLDSERDRREKIRAISDPEKQIEMLSELSIGDAGFTARTHNCLTRAGLRTMGDVAKLLYSDLSRLSGIRNLGRECLSEICGIMGDYGLDVRRNQYSLGIDGLESMDISQLDLSVRTYNGLSRAGLRNVRDISSTIENKPEEIIKIRQFGIKSITELCVKLEQKGIDCGNLRKMCVLPDSEKD